MKKQKEKTWSAVKGQEKEPPSRADNGVNKAKGGWGGGGACVCVCVGGAVQKMNLADPLV